MLFSSSKTIELFLFRVHQLRPKAIGGAASRSAGISIMHWQNLYRFCRRVPYAATTNRTAEPRLFPAPAQGAATPCPVYLSLKLCRQQLAIFETSVCARILNDILFAYPKRYMESKWVTIFSCAQYSKKLLLLKRINSDKRSRRLAGEYFDLPQRFMRFINLRGNPALPGGSQDLSHAALIVNLKSLPRNEDSG